MVERGMEIMKTFMEEDDTDELIKNLSKELNKEDKIEFINVIEKMLFFGPSASMKRFVRVLLDNSGDIETSMKCRILEYVYEADDPEYIGKLRKWLNEDDIEVACRVYWLKHISFYPLYKEEEQIADWMNIIFSHPIIVADDFYRNRIVMDAFHTYEDNQKFHIFINIMKEYKKQFNDPVMYKVVFAQSLIKKDGLEDPFIEECLDELISIMSSETEPLETQADICDFFLNTENHNIKKEYREQATEKMGELFRENMVSDLSIYANRQNVHSESIENSSQEILKQLHEKYGLYPITLSEFQKWRVEMEEWDQYTCLDEKTQDKITICMNRIFFDKRLYGKTGDTLISIFGLVETHTHHSDHKDELKNRLLEELTEASGQCSSGIAVRMINTLSGYDDFMLKISYKESILSKLMHHMNKKIMEIDDEELQDTLLHEMILPQCQYTSRKNFLEFFRKEIPFIKEHLYEEFQEFVSDTDFDLYLKQALIHYQG